MNLGFTTQDRERKRKKERKRGEKIERTNQKESLSVSVQRTERRFWSRFCHTVKMRQNHSSLSTGPHNSGRPQHTTHTKKIKNKNPMALKCSRITNHLDRQSTFLLSIYCDFQLSGSALRNCGSCEQTKKQTQGSYTSLIDTSRANLTCRSPKRDSEHKRLGARDNHTEKDHHTFFRTLF